MGIYLLPVYTHPQTTSTYKICNKSQKVLKVIVS